MIKKFLKQLIYTLLSGILLVASYLVVYYRVSWRWITESHLRRFIAAFFVVIGFIIFVVWFTNIFMTILLYGLIVCAIMALIWVCWLATK
jgi:hypothetical protein